MKTLSHLVLFFFLGSCASTPTGRSQLRLVDETKMAELGDQSYAQMKKKIPTSSDPRSNKYVRCITNHLLQAMGEDPNKWEITVFQDDSANAFALPGNNMGVHTGMLKLATSQEELAAVIGHEIAHVKANHGNERVSQNMLISGGLSIASVALTGSGNKNERLILAGLGLGAQFGVLLPFSRSHESEADILGQQYMARAGFNPQGAVTLWQKMAAQGGGGTPEFMSTHPSSNTRIQELSANIPKVASAYRQVRNKPNCRL